MNCITIKSHHTDGIVTVEMYDTDTDGVGGLEVRASELWRWLEQCQPCQVHLHVNDDALQRLVCTAGDLFQTSMWAGQAGTRTYDSEGSNATA
jgi:hypothetical protein